MEVSEVEWKLSGSARGAGGWCSAFAYIAVIRCKSSRSAPKGAADLRTLRESRRACWEPRSTKKPQVVLGAQKIISETERARERETNRTPAVLQQESRRIGKTMALFWAAEVLKGVQGDDWKRLGLYRRLGG